MSKDKQAEEQDKLTVELPPEPEKASEEQEGAASTDAGTKPHDHAKAKNAKPKKETAPADDAPSLKEIISEQATEDDLPLSKNITLRKILGGDILTTSTIRRQIWVFVLITFFLVIYVANRYSCQKYMIEIDQLQKELQHAKYKALSSSSQLTERCRESHVLDALKTNKDSVLKTPNQPPYIIHIPEE